MAGNNIYNVILPYAIFPFAPFLWKTGRLVRSQVAALKYNPHIAWLPGKRQRFLKMSDIGIDGTAVDTEITGGFTYRV